VKKDKTCPVCGSKMERLSHGLWTCKCGHREAEKPGEEETARVETDENWILGRQKGDSSEENVSFSQEEGNGQEEEENVN
jgi:hypothetical protein